MANFTVTMRGEETYQAEGEFLTEALVKLVDMIVLNGIMADEKLIANAFLDIEGASMIAVEMRKTG